MNLINEYLELEGTDTKLKWETGIEELHNLHGTNKLEQGDRTIYEWGEKQIINGLKLPLTSCYWNFGEDETNRRFDRIDFWAVGDKIASRWYNNIFKHLSTQFGQPNSSQTINDRDRLAIWLIGDVVIKLHMFEQHVYRTNFHIEKK